MPTMALDFSTIPLRPPPPGVTSDFVNPPTLAGTIIVITAVLCALPTIFVLLRLYTRLVLVHLFDVGDYLLLGGWFFAIANSITAMVETNSGFGRHAWDIPVTLFVPRSLICIWVITKLYVVSLGFTKSAILYMYPRISPSRGFRICVWVVLGLVASSSAAALVWDFVYCLPLSRLWELEVMLAHRCPFQRLAWLYFAGISNVVTDFAIFILPIAMLWHIALPRKKKFGVAIVLATGSFVAIVSVIRISITAEYTKSEDAVFRSVFIYLWSAAELHVAVICACMTTLRPFARRFLPSLGDRAGSRSMLMLRQYRNGQGFAELSGGRIQLREIIYNSGSSQQSNNNTITHQGQGFPNMGK